MGDCAVGSIRKQVDKLHRKADTNSCKAASAAPCCGHHDNPIHDAGDLALE